MAITYETVTPSPVENATVRKMMSDGVHRQFFINPNEGYLLHDKELDFSRIIDFDTMAEETYLGFTTGLCSCFRTYDWDTNPREFYCVPDNGSIPTDQIFGGTNNDHEIA